MPLVKVTPPPGVVKPGTEYAAGGQWVDSHLVRWHDGVMRPIGGWVPLEGRDVASGDFADGEGFTDFSEHAVGAGLPSGLTAHIDSGGSPTWSVASDPTADNHINMEAAANFDRTGFAVDAFSTAAFGEILTSVRKAVDSTDNVIFGGGAIGLAGNDATLDFHVIALQNFTDETDRLEARSMLNGTETNHGAVVVDSLGLQVGEWVWVRSRFDDAGGGDTRFRGKAWAYGSEEPAAYQLDMTVSVDQTAGGIGWLTIGSGIAATTDLHKVGYVAFSDSPDASPPAVPVDNVNLRERVCGTHSWRVNAGAARLAIGTPDKIYVFSEGVLEDVTPAGFTTGGDDASFSAGNFGVGPFGHGPFGTGDDSLETLTEAQTWQIDNYGEDLVAVAHSDGKLYYYDHSAGGDFAEASDAGGGTTPTSNLGVVVTPENYIMVLGAGGVARRLQWPSLVDPTDWEILTTNDARTLDLPGGAILAGLRGRGETLVWTDTALYALRFVGGNFVYSPTQIGQDGAISRRAMAVMSDGSAVWMGTQGFFVYDGFTRPLPSRMTDYVFGSFNAIQASKVWCEVRADFGEVIWHYPSGGSTECDRAVVYNHRMQLWYPVAGQDEVFTRTGGEDRGALPYAVAFDADGLGWIHEQGLGYDGITTLPYAESGPIEIGQGDRVASLREWIPDERTLGQLDLRLIGRMYPNGPIVFDETFDAGTTGRQDVRGEARQTQLRVQAAAAEVDWRLGVIRLDVAPSGMR